MKKLLVLRIGKGSALTAFLVLILSISIYAGQGAYIIEIKDHTFNPSVLVVPANQKIKLIVRNLDKTPEEFESYDLNREKMVPANSEVKIFIGPLKAGTYKFFGEFNPGTAQGVIKAIENLPGGSK